MAPASLPGPTRLSTRSSRSRPAESSRSEDAAKTTTGRAQPATRPPASPRASSRPLEPSNRAENSIQEGTHPATLMGPNHKRQVAVQGRLQRGGKRKAEDELTLDGDNILVCVRIKPSSAPCSLYRVSAPTGSITLDPQPGSRKKSKEYTTNCIYTSDSFTSELYGSSVAGLVRGAMGGVNGTLLAYGATGSGKTHTLTGDEKEDGLIRIAIKEIFHHIGADESRQYTVHIGYEEVYNERVVDLLPASSEPNSKGRTRRIPVVTRAELLGVVAAADGRRTSRSTEFNAKSSRSHAILSLTVESCPKASVDLPPSSNAVRVGQLKFVDLAGSEATIAKTGDNKKDAEGMLINKSLFTLRNVIGQLVRKVKVVAYRDSALTRLLQPSLSGNSSVVVICNISLDEKLIERTSNTLEFAEQLRKVILLPSTPESEPEPANLAAYKLKVLELEQEIARLSEVEKLASSKEAEIHQERARADALEAQLKELREERSKVSSFIIPGGAPTPAQTDAIVTPPVVAPSSAHPRPADITFQAEASVPNTSAPPVDCRSGRPSVIVSPPTSQTSPEPSVSSVKIEVASAALHSTPSAARSDPPAVASVASRKPTPAPATDVSAYLSLMFPTAPLAAGTSTTAKPVNSSTSTSTTAPPKPSSRLTPLTQAALNPALPRVTWRREITFSLSTSFPFSTCFPTLSLESSVRTPSGHISSASALAVVVREGWDPKGVDVKTGKGFRTITDKAELYPFVGVDKKTGAKMKAKFPQMGVVKGWMCRECAIGEKKPKEGLVFGGVKEVAGHYARVHGCSVRVG